MLSGSLSPGTCTRMRSLPWRWMVGSRVPTSSIRRRTISSDWVTAARRFLDRVIGQPDLDPSVAGLLDHQLAREASALVELLHHSSARGALPDRSGR